MQMSILYAFPGPAGVSSLFITPTFFKQAIDNHFIRGLRDKMNAYSTSPKTVFTSSRQTAFGAGDDIWLSATFATRKTLNPQQSEIV